MKMKFVAMTASIALLMSGCATGLLLTKTEPTTYLAKSEQQTIFTDQVVAIGFPKTPIKNFENAMVMAGNKYSYLIKPMASKDKPELHETQDIFQQIFTNIDLQYFYIDTQNTQKNTININKIHTTKSNKISFYMGSFEDPDYTYDTKDLNGVRRTIPVAFIKPVYSLKDNEKTQLEAMDFSCEFQIASQQKYLTCSRSIVVTLTVAPKVKNFDNLNHRLKQPIDFEVSGHQKIYKENTGEQLFKLLLPVTVAFDIVSSPIQAIGLVYLEKNLHIP